MKASKGDRRPSAKPTATDSVAQSPPPRVRAIDKRNAPKAVSEEVDRYMDLDKRITVAKLQDRIAKESKESRDASRSSGRLPPGNDGTKYPVALPIDLAREREYERLREDICDDPSGVPLDRMIDRTLERKDQRVALEKRLQPSMMTIGSQKQPWEFQLMLAQRHSDDGDFLHDDFFAVLDSKAAVSDALHRHHSTAEMRAAVTHTFDDWVDVVQRQQPVVNEEVADRLNDMQRDVAIATESQRTVDEAMMNMANTVDQLHTVRMNVQDISQRVAWAENNRLLSKQSSHKLFSRTRHVATLTDLTFRTDLLDPTDGEDDDEDDDDGFQVDGAVETETAYDGRSAATSRAHSSVAPQRRRGDGGMRGHGGSSSDSAGQSAALNDEHNRQLAALEKKLRQRYEAMMKMLKTAVAERRMHNDQELHLKRLVELRDTEIIRLRSLYKGLIENRGFTALWDLTREDVTASIPLHPGTVEAALQKQDEAVGIEDVLRKVVEEVLAEAHRDGVLSTSSRIASPVHADKNDNFGIVLEEEGQDGAEVYRELNDLKRDHAALKEKTENLHSEGQHREELYQRLSQRFTALTQEHLNMEQILAATEEDRASKTTRLVDAEKALRELTSKIAGFDRAKAEELAQQQAAFDAEKALLDRRAADLEKDLQAMINKYEKNNGGGDADESPEIKFRKANAKVQELETQVRTLKGLNGALDNNAKTLQHEVHQLIQNAIGFVEPLGEHLSAARSHLLGGTSLRGMEATRVCVWSDLDALLSHCRNGFLKGVMRHSTDPLFPEILQQLDQLLAVGLTEMEEDKGTKSLEKELHKMTQANRELKVQLKRAEGELAHLRSNKTQVVDSIRAAATRLAEEAEAAAGETLDIEDIPLTSDDDDDDDDAYSSELLRNNSDGTSFSSPYFSETPGDMQSAAASHGFATAATSSNNRSGVFSGAGGIGLNRSFRRASNVADGMRKRSIILRDEVDPSAASVASLGGNSGPASPPFQAFPAMVSSDPSPEGAFAAPPNSNVDTPNATNLAEGGRRRSILLQSSRRRSTQQLVQTGESPLDGQVVANRAAPPLAASMRSDVSFNRPHRSSPPQAEASPSPHRAASTRSHAASEASISVRRASARGDSMVSAMGRERSGSASMISTIYQDEGTQQVLEAAFANMRLRMDDALQQRDAAMSKAAAMTRDLQVQSVRMADTGAAVLEEVLAKARHACYVLREASSAYAASVLGAIESNRNRIWIPAEAEPLLVEAKQTLPRQALGVVRAIVRRTCFYHVRKTSYQRMLDGMFSDARDLGDVMTTGLWRRRMLHMEQQHAVGLSTMLKDLTDIHQRRIGLLQKLEVLIELPKGGGRSGASDRSKTPPPPIPLSDHATPRGASSGPSSGPPQTLEDIYTGPPPVECSDAFCTTSTPSAPPLVLGTTVTAAVKFLTGAIGNYFTAGGVGLQNAALEALQSFARQELHGVGDALLEGAGGPNGIAEHDTWVIQQTGELEEQARSLGAQLSQFQSRVESEAYLRFVAPSAATDEALGDDNGASALQNMLSALDDEDPSDNADKADEGDADTAAADALENLKHAETTAAAVEAVDAAWTKRYQQLDGKHKQLEVTFKDVKQQLRKLLKSVTADKFAHIETRPWVLNDVLQMNRGRILQALAHATAQANGAAASVDNCPCPVCGKMIVTSPQKPVGRHHRSIPLVTNACTETVLEEGEALPPVSMLDDGGVAWADPVNTTGRDGSQSSKVHQYRPLPSSSIGAAADSGFAVISKRAASANDQYMGSNHNTEEVSFQPSAKNMTSAADIMISPLQWNLGPLPYLQHPRDRPHSTTPPMYHHHSHDGSIPTTSNAEDVPLLRFTPRVTSAGRSHSQTFRNFSTQTDANLVAPMLMEILNRLPQHAPFVLRPEGVHEADPSAINTAKTGRNDASSDATIANVRDRLWKFSTERRASIALEISKDASFELLGEGLGLLPHKRSDERIQTRVSQAVVGRRALSPQHHTSSPSSFVSDNASMMTIAAHVESPSECSTLVITSGHHGSSQHQPPPSAPLTLADKETALGNATSVFRQTLNTALQRGGSAQRTPDVHRRLPSASLTRGMPGQEVQTAFGIVGQRPPSAGSGTSAAVASSASTQRAQMRGKPLMPSVSAASTNSFMPTDDPSDIVAPAFVQQQPAQRPLSAVTTAIDSGTTLASVSSPTVVPFPTDVVHIPTSRPGSGAATRTTTGTR